MLLKPFHIIRQYKQNNDITKRFKLPILDNKGQNLGELVCIDDALSKESMLVNDLTYWRSQHMRYFLTQFTATPERTAAWLERVVLQSDDRILFLICTETGESIGNFGVCNIGTIRGELDNLIRGRKGGHPRLVYYSELAMLAWLFGSLSLQEANLWVFSNNIRTIQLHSSIGFSICQTKRISRSKDGNEVHLLIDSYEGEEVNNSYHEMQLKKDCFLRLHPWVAEIYPNFE
jgi:hypothetical protein